MILNEKDFMEQRNFPLRLTAEQVSWIVGVTVEDVTVLMSKGLLVPIGNPRQSSVKHFYRNELEQLGRSHKWIDKVERCLDAYWLNKKARRAELKAVKLATSSPEAGPPNQP